MTLRLNEQWHRQDTILAQQRRAFTNDQQVILQHCIMGFEEKLEVAEVLSQVKLSMRTSTQKMFFLKKLHNMGNVLQEKLLFRKTCPLAIFLEKKVEHPLRRSCPGVGDLASSAPAHCRNGSHWKERKSGHFFENTKMESYTRDKDIWPA